MTDSSDDEKLARKLQQIQKEMDRLDDRDTYFMKQSYRDPDAAEDRMVAYRDEHGEMALFLALRQNPEQFGDYPEEKARFDEAYMARKELPVVFAQYKKLRDEADLIQMERERMGREREDDLGPRR